MHAKLNVPVCMTFLGGGALDEEVKPEMKISQ
jgi:hypothetical protein